MFAYNDVVNSSENSFQGEMFNQSSFNKSGINIYEGITIDY